MSRQRTLAERVAGIEGTEVSGEFMRHAAPGRDAFAGLIARIASLLGGTESSRPIPAAGLRFGWPPAGLKFETQATRGERAFLLHYLNLALFTLFAWALFRFNIKLRGFDPALYRILPCIECP